MKQAVYSSDPWPMLPRLVLVSLVALLALPWLAPLVLPSPEDLPLGRASMLESVLALAPFAFAAVVTATLGVRLFGWSGGARFAGSLLASLVGSLAAATVALLLHFLGLIAVLATGWAAGDVLADVICPRLAKARRGQVDSTPASSAGPAAVGVGKGDPATPPNRRSRVVFRALGVTIAAAIALIAVWSVRAGGLSIDVLLNEMYPCAAWAQAIMVTAVLGTATRKGTA